MGKQAAGEQTGWAGGSVTAAGAVLTDDSRVTGFFVEGDQVAQERRVDQRLVAEQDESGIDVRGFEGGQGRRAETRPYPLPKRR